MIKERASIAHIAADLHVSKCAISDIKQAETGLPDTTKPTRKAGTGTKKTTDGTNPVWPGDVMLNHSITTANLKRKLTMLLQDIFIRTIQPRPEKDLNL